MKTLAPLLALALACLVFGLMIVYWQLAVVFGLSGAFWAYIVIWFGGTSRADVPPAYRWMFPK